MSEMTECQERNCAQLVGARIDYGAEFMEGFVQYVLDWNERAGHNIELSKSALASILSYYRSQKQYLELREKFSLGPPAHNPCLIEKVLAKAEMFEVHKMSEREAQRKYREEVRPELAGQCTAGDIEFLKSLGIK